MPGALFQPTVPFGEPALIRASGFQVYLRELESDALDSGVSSRISSLNASLRDDLLRFEQRDGGSEALEVMAACLRHARRLTIHLQCDEHVVPLTVFPHERLVHCPMPLPQLLARPLAALRVMHVEPALLRPPGDEQKALVGEPQMHHPLMPLLWELAMRGQRSELLPEIGGAAVYRVSPGLDMRVLPPRGSLRAATLRLQRQVATLREVSGWPGMDRERAARLLNALYLQASLIVSRSHPDAVRDRWF
jgi:hypothetical protein